jgi:hypothetical protein
MYIRYRSTLGEKRLNILLSRVKTETSNKDFVLFLSTGGWSYFGRGFFVVTFTMAFFFWHREGSLLLTRFVTTLLCFDPFVVHRNRVLFITIFGRLRFFPFHTLLLRNRRSLGGLDLLRFL